MHKKSIADLMLKIFLGREDVVAIHWESRDSRAGYKPFKDKSNRYVSLSESVLLDHIEGKIILALYPLLKDSRCSFVAADFDNKNNKGDAMDEVKRYYSICNDNDVPCYVIRSKSGLGYHVYIFFENLVPASQARSFAKYLLDLSGVSKEPLYFDRFFPAQDKIGCKGFGNPIALPFQGKAMKSKNTLILDPAENFVTPYSDQIAILNKLKKVTEDNFLQINKKVPTTYHKKTTIQRIFKENQGIPANKKRDELFSDFDKVYNECQFIAHCKDDAVDLPYKDWWAMISNVVRCEDGRNLVHQLSRPYPRYSYRETERMIYNAIRFPYPLRCAYIEDNIAGQYCSMCEYQKKIRYPAMIGIDLVRFADSLSYEENVHTDFDSGHLAPLPSDVIDFKQDHHAEIDWSHEIDDMDSEFWGNYMGGPDDLEVSLNEDGIDEYEETTPIWINRYVCSICRTSNRISSDLANKILINANCKYCNEYTRQIHWKAFRYNSY